MKRALVTGASGDIGAAICFRLARNDVHVIAHANQNTNRAADVVEKINSAKGSAELVVFDITDSDLTTARLTALSDQDPIQIIVNNAGIHHDDPMAGMSLEVWKTVIDVSLHGFFNVTQPLLLPMIQTRWGRIVNMSSVAAVWGNRGQVNYAAAKSALHGATKSLAMELASRGITVNAVAPGFIKGSVIDKAVSEQQIKATVPMQRSGSPDEVAALVEFLCSVDAGYISGQIIGINGAMV